jgi:DNA mismatch repair protein MutS
MATQGELTPMLRHYLEVKARYPDGILLYRMGDFFEIFYDDAVRAAPILQVTLTARHKGKPSEVPMCGVPHHALQGYLAKLVNAGLKAVICDQLEDPATAKGLVKRDVVGVVTPGTISQPNLLESKEENLLACLVWNDRKGAGAFLDVSTGSFFVHRWETTDECLETLGVLRPREVLAEPGKVPGEVEGWIHRELPCFTALEDDLLVDRRRAAELLHRQLGTTTLRGFGLDDQEPAVLAAACALAYAQTTQQSGLSHVRTLAVRNAADYMVLDATTLANLEVFRPQREGARGATLLAVVDQSATPAGGRLLRDWLRRPLVDPAAVRRRHDAVEELAADHRMREELRGWLAQLGDPERLLGRAVLGSLTPREAAALRDGLRQVPDVLASVRCCAVELLAEVAAVDPLEDLTAELDRMLVDSPPQTLKDGGVIADGVDPELDEARSLARDSKRHIASLEAVEREKTGIASLKIRYNKVFGYYLEVTKANQHLVPDHFVRKQTLVNAERYVTPEVKELEEKILSAEERQIELEHRYFDALRGRIVDAGARLRETAHALATLDVAAGFAELAVKRRYCRPRVTQAGAPIVVREGRHPVVEATSSEPFVPNDVELGAGGGRIVVLTGPNMGGKSTYLRQVALIVLLAQAGSFVPADSAEIGAVDRIFTRVGASDDLARGESTFMVEMIETANILHHATAESLVILDEVGRGTATFDGLSLAWAIVEHLHEHACPKTLFATHYHELTELAATLDGVVNRTLAVKEWEDQILFLKRVVPGSADKSYGLHVARLAGLPEPLLARAQEVLANLEAKEYDPTGQPRLAQGERAPSQAGRDAQLSLFTPPEEVVAQVLRELDVEAMTPLAALNLLHGLKTRLGG